MWVLETMKSVLGLEHLNTLQQYTQSGVDVWNHEWGNEAEELEVKVVETRKSVPRG